MIGLVKDVACLAVRRSMDLATVTISVVSNTTAVKIMDCWDAIVSHILLTPCQSCLSSC